MLRIGLTGGIASGKTTVANLFAARGVPVIDADQVAREVVEPGSPTLALVVAAFGPEVLDENGGLDRPRMRERIFADAAARKRYEAILHPAIREAMAAHGTRAGGPYQMWVVPLLVERGSASAYDQILVVDCPEEDQLRRVQARDGTDRIQAQRILDAQATRAQRLSAADDVIFNAGDIGQLSAQVDRLHAKYSDAAKAR